MGLVRGDAWDSWEAEVGAGSVMDVNVEMDGNRSSFKLGERLPGEDDVDTDSKLEPIELSPHRLFGR